MKIGDAVLNFCLDKPLVLKWPKPSFLIPDRSQGQHIFEDLICVNSTFDSR